MSSPGQHDSSGDGQAMAVAAVFGLFLLVLFWVAYGQTVLWALLEVARFLMVPPTWLAAVLPADYIANYNKVATYLNSAADTGLVESDMAIVYRFLSRSYYFVFLIPIAWLSIALWRRPVALQYRGKLTLQQLILRNMRYYPQIRPAFFHDLLETDPDKGPFARAMDYRGFAEKHALLLDENDAPVPWRSWYSDADDPTTYEGGETGDPSKPRVPVPFPAKGLDGPATRAVFAAQLGPLWDGHESLPVFHRALFGVLVARIARDKLAADAALVQMNASWTEKPNGRHRMKCKLALRLAAKHHDKFEVSHLYSKHAFRNTLFAALLTEAQGRSGSFPTSMFLWLKVVDRTLFYAMNQVGRAVGWPEAAGVRSHFLAETHRSERVDQPVVEPAVRALAAHLAKESYLDISQPIREPSREQVDPADAG